MRGDFQPEGRALLAGSQPLKTHLEATELILTHTPEIPHWVQLPLYPEEGMVAQFMPGLPGLVRRNGRFFVDTAGAGFDDEMVAFFEEYLAVTEAGGDWDSSRFVLTSETAKGFFVLLERLSNRPDSLWAVKGQITGPITFCTAMKDQNRSAIFYNDTLRDAAVKLLALKGAWQARQLGRLGMPVIVFVDEPALAGYGSSEFISISREQITACLQEVIAAIQGQGGLVGVHVCANTDWSLLLDSQVDIINFDAHGYFDKFVLYGDRIKAFLQSGRCLAWGLVPTLQPEVIEAATLELLWQDWLDKSAHISTLGVAAKTVRSHALITPSCGTGTLSPALSRKVLELTQALSQRIRGLS